MKERPILFSAPMIRAILAGNKTQTRRIVKGYEPDYSIGVKAVPSDLSAMRSDPDFHFINKCPYGQVGDQLWVREAWRWNDGTECGCSEFCTHTGTGYEYRASGAGDIDTKWKPSIHMPRLASRIQLEITGIRVERLNDISEADAIAEGIENIGKVIDCWKNYEADHEFRDAEGRQKAGIAFNTAVPSFASLWQSINGAGSWDANPWVWAISFKRVEVPA